MHIWLQIHVLVYSIIDDKPKLNNLFFSTHGFEELPRTVHCLKESSLFNESEICFLNQDGSAYLIHVVNMISSRDCVIIIIIGRMQNGFSRF